MRASICFLILGMAFVLGKQVYAQAYVDQDLLAMVEDISVSVTMSADSDARQCLPFESTIKTRIELALQRSGFDIVNDAPSALVSFSAVGISPAKGCAVGHDIQIAVPVLTTYGFITAGLALQNGGIFSRATATQSTQYIRSLADDATDTVINEILKARRSRQ